MFEDITSLDFDDEGILETSFTPTTCSTQTFSVRKRLGEDPDKDNPKKLKVLNNEQNVIHHSEYASYSKDLNPSYTSVNSPNRVMKRKFPGPAGLLPERIASNKSILELIADKADDTQDEVLLCSQRTISVFEESPWKDMTKDFYVPNEECLYEKFNISWIKRQASLKKLLTNHKAPFLAAVIQSLEIFDGRVPTVNVTLKDTTGEIQGTILYSLYEEYSNFFTIGSVLVLKQFGVLSAGYNNHCLTITLNNLVTIYSLEISKDSPYSDGSRQVSDKTGSGLVKKIVIQECKIDEIMKKYHEDVLASEQQQRSINFPRLHRNHSNLLRNNSGPEKCTISGRAKSSFQNNKNYENDSNLSEFNNSSRTDNINNSNPNVSLQALSRISSVDNTSKKKFNFKQTGCFQKTSDTGNKPLVLGVGFDTMSCIEKGISENRDSDNVVVRNSQISVKSTSKEHTEIWKNLLQDVDADSLFDDF